MEEQTTQQQNTAQPNIFMVKPKLKSTFDLMGEAFKIFKRKWKLFVLIQIIPLALSLILGVFEPVTESEERALSLPITMVMVILGILMLVLGIWAMCALMLSVVEYKEEGKIWKDYFREGIKIFWGILGVWILVGLATLGGLILFIIPGFIFAIWFGFAIWAYVEAGKGSGIVNAMRESKRVVKGYFWSIVWRNFIFGILIGLGILIVYAILIILIGLVSGGNKMVSTLLINIFSLPIQIVLTPVSLLFAYLLYGNVRELGAEKRNDGLK